MEKYYVVYGEGEAGMYTIYGFGKTRDEAKRDSVQYGYDIERDDPWLFADEISEKALEYIKTQGCNNMEDEVFHWDAKSKYLMMKEEYTEAEVKV